MTRLKGALAAQLCRFAQHTDGASSALAFVLFVISAMIGGLAVDGMNISRTRTIMQVAADTTAHAAMYYRAIHGEETAKQKALPIGLAGMPESVYGSGLTVSDIQFGMWSPDTLSFSASEGSEIAVRVTVTLHTDRDNALRTFLLRLMGKTSFNLSVSSIYALQIHPCQTQGFAARGKVDVRSENEFLKYFCIHSNDYVEFNNGSYFETGVVVSMPDLSKLWLPGSGYKNNPGLEQALRRAKLDFGVIDALPEIIDSLEAASSGVTPDYITNTTVLDLDPNNLASSDFQPGRIHRLQCRNTGGKTTIPDGSLIAGAVVVSNCEIKFGKDVVMRDAILATRATGKRSFNGSAGVVVGYNDGCLEGGGAKLITLGGMAFPSKLQVYGGQLMAAKDIVFAAQANGIYGASFVSGAEISGTSNLKFGTCETGVDDPLGTLVPRLVN